MNDMDAVYPDGLTGEAIEALLSEARACWALSNGATSAVQDGTAVARRDRRIARRAIGAVVRALPTRPAQVISDDVPSGEVA